MTGGATVHNHIRMYQLLLTQEAKAAPSFLELEKGGEEGRYNTKY
jgi:hypothetical protein